MTYLVGTRRFIRRCQVAITNTIFRIVTRIAELIVVVALAVYYFTESFILTLAPSFLIPEKDISGKIALVTGGAGGVGKELVLRLAKHKLTVIVWDNNSKALEKLEEDLKKLGLTIHTYTVDITDKDLVYKYAKIVKEELGPVDILINNAGVVCGQTFLDIPDYMIEKTFKVNVISHYWTAKSFLPDMIKRRTGHIVTVGSLTGLLGTYKCVDYSASKYATIGFHESLMTELKTHGHHRIKMTLICPYFINTGMFDGCKPRNLPMLEAKDVARRIIKAIKREEVFVTLPGFARYTLPLKNYLPPKLTWALIIKVIQGPQSMKGMRSFKEVEAA
ncbi:unnamed protein product [Psylliodes chrysocephalus]|uniref:Short-chain dehydrogenase/reductase 3 n=1 Tax=Psylliodes chrysocephalus TaxID=3402493 RepID=A0A9P0G5D6_9CUCU|nr:unnamed protein product [Psylliodes chrysocephala]